MYAGNAVLCMASTQLVCVTGANDRDVRIWDFNDDRPPRIPHSVASYKWKFSKVSAIIILNRKCTRALIFPEFHQRKLGHAFSAPVSVEYGGGGERDAPQFAPRDCLARGKKCKSTRAGWGGGCRSWFVQFCSSLRNRWVG